MYATVFHVEKYVPARAPFTANTKPSATQVAGLILDVESELEAELALAGYAIPIPATATVAFQRIQTVVAKCTAAAVEAVAPNADDKKRDLAQKMCAEARAALAAQPLPGVDLNVAESSPRSGFYPSAFITRDMDL